MQTINGPIEKLRRDFLIAICSGAGGVIALILAVPFVGFLLAPLFRRAEQTWRPLGPVEKFAIGEMVLVTYVESSPLAWGGVTANSAAYVHRLAEHSWEAFSSHCTHLGCPVRYLPEAKLFMCPCHGGVYYSNGAVAAGPPPHDLVRINLRERDGQLELLTIPVPIT